MWFISNHDEYKREVSVLQTLVAKDSVLSRAAFASTLTSFELRKLKTLWNTTRRSSRYCKFTILVGAFIAISSCCDVSKKGGLWIQNEGADVRFGISQASEVVSVSNAIVDDVVGRQPTLMIEVADENGRRIERCAHAMISGVRSHLVVPGAAFSMTLPMQTVRDRYCVEHGYLNTAVGEASGDGGVIVKWRSRRVKF